MEEHIASMMEGRQRYREAFTALVKEYNSAGSQPTESTDVAVELAKENLKEEHKRLVSTNRKAIAFFDKKIEQVNKLQAELQGNAPELDYAQVKERLMQIIKGKEELESEAQHGAGVADVSEEHRMVVSQALADLVLSRPELEEEAVLVHNNMAAVPAETVKHEAAALPVLPDPDPSTNNA